MNDQPIEGDERELREGTSIYDTEYDRVLWVEGIDEYEVRVEVVEPYTDDDPIWWSDDGDPTTVGDGVGIDVDEFASLLETGRFEIGPQPRDGPAVDGRRR